MKKLVTLLLFITLLLTSIACQTTTQNKNTFTSALTSDPPAIDPANAIESSGQQITQLLFDGLVKNNPKTLAIEPSVAKSWTISKDAKTFTFKLKKGTNFHNGEEVTAQNFKNAFDFIANPKTKSQASYYFEQIEGYSQMQDKKATELKGVKVIDKYTLQITLSTPLVDFVRNLAATAFAPLPKDFAKNDFAKKPVGNGPYKFVSWKHNKEIKLTKFDDYFDEKAKTKTVTFKIFTNENTAFQEFRAGSIDDAPIPQNLVNFQKENSKQKIVYVPILSTYSYAFNLKKKPWDNEKLRAAIAYAINKKEIAEKTVTKNTVEATSFTAKAVPGNNEPLTDITYQPAKVKSLLKEAGYNSAADVKEFKINYSNKLPSSGKVAQVVQSQLEKAGFKVKIEGLESGTFIDKMLGGEFEIFSLSWVGDSNFDAFLDPIFSTDNIGLNNVTNYSNEKVDKLIVKAQATLNDGKRIELYKKAERIILGEVPIIPLYYDSTTFAVKPSVKNYQRNAFAEVAAERITIP